MDLSEIPKYYTLKFDEEEGIALRDILYKIDGELRQAGFKNLRLKKKEKE